MSRVLSVLIIEDETSFATVIGEELKETKQYEVTLADSGESGIEQLKSKTFDVVLLDNKLGDITGLQVLEWMSEQKLDTPVIMMTGFSTDEIAVEAMKLGAYDYVRKERIELDHIPILIHGVHERHLFRKEKEARDQERHELEKRQAAVQMFQTTVRTIAHHINNALAVFMLRSSVTERNLKKSLEATQAEQVVKLVSDLRRQAEIIEAIVRSLVGISDVVYTKYASDQEIIDIRSQLEKNLELLKTQKLESLS
jgi:ActR/RegA family two-component response regulator